MKKLPLNNPGFEYLEKGFKEWLDNSKTAIEVNIQIIRIFTRIREVLLTHKDVLLKMEQLEKNNA